MSASHDSKKRKSKAESIEAIEQESDPAPGTASKSKQGKKTKKEVEIEEPETQNAKVRFTAIVIGGTGAVGRYVVTELLAQDRWSKVVVIGRRSGVPDYYPESEKLVEILGSLDGMCESTSEVFKAFSEHAPEAAFCCLGTTMEVAKSKAAFKKVDFGYVTDFAWLARKFNVSSFNLISSMGSSATSPFLYPRTKGKSENFVKALNFPITLIYRPGLLGRDDPTGIEKAYGKISKPLPAPFFAKVITHAPLDILDNHPNLAQNNLIDDESMAKNMWRQTWDNDKIFKFAKTHGIQKQKYQPKGKVEAK